MLFLKQMLPEAGVGDDANDNGNDNEEEIEGDGDVGDDDRDGHDCSGGPVLLCKKADTAKRLINPERTRCCVCVRRSGR